MMNVYFNFYIFAQSAGKAAQETAEETKELLTKITTFKVTQALMIILSCYVTLRIIDWSIIWVSERIAREWRLRVKQLLPFFRTVVLTTTIITLMNLFLNLSPENILAVTGAAAVALGFAFKDFASSIIAGIVGIFEGSYRVGDRIKIGEVAQLEYDLCDAPLLLNFKKLKAYGYSPFGARREAELHQSRFARRWRIRAVFALGGSANAQIVVLRRLQSFALCAPCLELRATNRNIRYVIP